MSDWRMFLIVVLTLFHRVHCQIKAVPYDLMGSPPALVGSMRQNDHLTKTERYKEGEVKGAESFVYHNGKIYTGLSDGRIVDISECGVRTIARLPCNQDRCARPRGMRLSPDKASLLVAVANVGIVRVNIVTGLMEKLFGIETPVNGKRCKYINDIAVAKDGTIFFTDSSARWGGDKFLYIVLEGESTGRLIALDPWSRATFVVIDQMSYPNGLEFGPNEQFLLVAETNRARIRKLDLRINTPYWRRQTLFAANLPGLPENIRSSGRGTYWVGMGQSRNSAMRSSWVDTYAKQPDMREMIAMMATIDQILEIKERYGTVIELGNNGNILRSLQDPTGKRVWAVTEVMERDGYLYLGSRVDEYISRVPLTEKFDVDRFIAKIKSTCRATKITNIENLRKVLRRLVAIAEFRRALLEYKRRREEEEAKMSTTTAASVLSTDATTSSSAVTDSTTTAATFTGSTTTGPPTSTSGQMTSAASAATPSPVSTSTTAAGPASTTTVSDDPDVPASTSTTSATPTASTATQASSPTSATSSTASSVTGSTAATYSGSTASSTGTGATSTSTTSSATVSGATASTSTATVSTATASASTASTATSATSSSATSQSTSAATASSATTQPSTPATPP